MVSSGELTRYDYEFRSWLPPSVPQPLRRSSALRRLPASRVRAFCNGSWLPGWPAGTVQATPPRTRVSRLDGDHLWERLAGTPGRVRTRRPAAEKVPHRRPAESPACALAGRRPWAATRCQPGAWPRPRQDRAHHRSSRAGCKSWVWPTRVSTRVRWTAGRGPVAPAAGLPARNKRRREAHGYVGSASQFQAILCGKSWDPAQWHLGTVVYVETFAIEPPSRMDGPWNQKLLDLSAYSTAWVRSYKTMPCEG